MNLCFIIKLLYSRSQMLSHDKWIREDIEKYQAKALQKLRTHAYANSPFYKRFHRNLFNWPLNELPILTKKELMNNFDELTTDRKMNLQDIYSHIANLKGNETYLNKYRVSSTSGSTGLKGVFPLNENEWATASASYLRASDWAGVKVGLTKRLKVAVVGSTTPWHVSSRVGATLNSWWIPTISIDTAEPIGEIVKKLNDFQPECLMAYANAARLLAEQQIAGNLKISLKAVFCTSEVLTEDSRERIYRAFGVKPFNIYATTETAGFASECNQHNGLHLYEDLVITEVVDDHNKPVPNGEYGTKILVTVLSSRTIPLIRYEMSDSIKLEDTECPCGLPFRIIGGIQGRKEETLYLPDNYGKPVKLEPNLFHKIMEIIPVAGWQIIQDKQNTIRILICEPRCEFSEDLLMEKLQTELGYVNVHPEIQVEYTSKLQQTETGKTILITSRAFKNIDLKVN